MPDNLGFDISTDESLRKDAFLFGERQSRVVVSVAPEKQDDFIEQLMEMVVEFNLLGEVTSSQVIIDQQNWGEITEWKQMYEEAIGKEMNVQEVVS